MRMNFSQSMWLLSLVLSFFVLCAPAFADYQIKSDDIRVDASQFEDNLSLNATDVQKALEEIDALGVEGPQGPAGSDGEAGPNLVGSTTSTDLTGILKGTGTNVTTAEAGVDYVTGTPWTSEGYLTDAPSDGSQYLRLNGAWSTVTIPAGTTARGITATFNGSGMPPAVSTKARVRVPYSGTITGWTITSDVSGSAVVSVWKDTYANYPPLVADAISGTEKPTLSTATKTQDLSLTTWSTLAITEGDFLVFNVDSASTLTEIVVQLHVTAST